MMAGPRLYGFLTSNEHETARFCLLIEYQLQGKRSDCHEVVHVFGMTSY